MNDLVNELKEARINLIRTVDRFPEGKRELILFDEWNLKDILSHLSGWAKYQTETLKLLSITGKVELKKSLKESINDDFVFRRNKWGWDRVYKEFVKLSEDLVSEYHNITRESWKKKIYHDKNTTVEDFIKIEINHYSKTHGPQIKKASTGLEIRK